MLQVLVPWSSKLQITPGTRDEGSTVELSTWKYTIFLSSLIWIRGVRENISLTRVVFPETRVLNY